jgi:hypothetical protein
LCLYRQDSNQKTLNLLLLVLKNPLRKKPLCPFLDSLPELGIASRIQIATLVGLAPFS